MNSINLAQIRFTILFWIVLPVISAVFSFALVQALGGFEGDQLGAFGFGTVLVASAIIFFGAHVMFCSALSGVVAIFWLAADRTFILSILVGLAVGGLLLARIYLD